MPNALETFRTAALAAGYDEVLARQWPPHAVADTHTHPFAAYARVVSGEMWLTIDDHTRHLLPGDEFTLVQGQPHAERYGEQGAEYWVARRVGV